MGNADENGTLYSASDISYQLPDSSLWVENGKVLFDREGVLRCAEDGNRLIINMETAMRSCPACGTTALQVLTNSLV